MSETLDLVAAVGPAIDAVLLEDAVQVLVRSGWSNSNEETIIKSPEARELYFGGLPADNSVAVVGRFDGEPVSAAMGRIETWERVGRDDQYMGFLGKQALHLTQFGVRIPYRNLGFGTQTLAAVAHVGHLSDCSLMAMHWADFQWDWFQSRGAFEGKFGLIAESVRSLPMRYPGFDPAQLQILS